MEIFIGILAGFVFASIIGIVVWQSSKKNSQNGDSSLLLKQDLLSINKELQTLKDSLNQTVNDRLDRNNELMSNSMHKQFSESSKLI
nr:hypothetical protein [Candidatus Saccharibacteria bacterium]